MTMKRMKKKISFTELADAARRYAGATLRWRARMGLEPRHPALDAEGERE
jgi:hypothetical protein